MLVKRINYTDYNGNQRSEDFYFNLNKGEIFNLQFGTEGGLDKAIQKIIDTQDVPKIVSMFQDIILNSYGVKSEDGRRFIKSEELKNEFKQTEAYSELLMELVQDEKKAAEFINGLMPKELAKETDKYIKEDGTIDKSLLEKKDE
jgi:hypothetical protein